MTAPADRSQTTQNGSTGAIRRLRLIFFVFLASLAWPTAEAVASDDQNVNTVIEEAQRALQRRDCKTAWNLVWPLAKSGDAHARHFLYMSIATGQLMWPGVTSDHSKFYRSRLTFVAYAATTPDEQLSFRSDPDRRWIRVDIINTIRSAWLQSSEDKDRVTECYAAGEPFLTCLNLAVSLGVIARFEEFARDLEREERTTGVAAQCPQRH